MSMQNLSQNCVSDADLQKAISGNHAIAHGTESQSAIQRQSAGGLRKMPTKYGNVKTTIDGITFDSKHEATRYCELKYMERAGLIKDLKRQVKYELIPATYEGKKLIARSISYIADFVYTENGKTVVEDAKGCRTEVYKIKKKIMRWKYGVEIKEV